MGSCQAVCGAATSGKGLSGRQVATALSAAAALQLKHHNERMEAAQNTDSREGGDERPGDSIAFEQLIEADYTEERSLNLQVPGSDGATENVTVCEYAPHVFRFLRQIDCVDEETFAKEWTLPAERLDLELGDGRSMALFLKSKSMHLMCKTIAKVEVDVLLRLLPNYTRYFAENPNTLLMRFSMLLRVEVDREVGYVLCFGDVFAPCRTLNEKWDLKGRKPKPGKYNHFPKFIRRPHEPCPYVIDTPREVVNPPPTSPSDVTPDMEVIVEATDKNKLATQKDKDLTRLFWLNKSDRAKLLDILLRDYRFLCDFGLMDYSLLIGVAYNESKVSRSGKRIRSMRMTHPMGRELECTMENRPELMMQNYRSSQEFANGVASLYDQEVYYIGIIDMLTPYTFKKKLARFFKSFLWKEDTLSTIPPRQYHERLVRYTKIIFPEPYH